MSTALAIQTEFQTDFVKPRENGFGAIIHADIDYENWHDAVNQAADHLTRHRVGAQSMLFILADLFNYGEDHYGEQYSQALNAGTLDEKTVDNIQRVARQIPAEQRHPGLSFAHHEVVAAVKDAKVREALLTEFEEKESTVAEAREIRFAKCPGKRQKANPKPKSAGIARNEPETALDTLDHVNRCREAINYIKSQEAALPLREWSVHSIALWRDIWAEFRRMERRAGLGHGSGGKK